MRQARGMRGATLALGGFMAGVLLLSGCGSSASTVDASAAQAKQLKGQALVDAAKKEGRLTWYTSYSDDETRQLIADFNKAYPGVEVTTLQGSAGDLAARVETEQKGGTFKADLFQGDASYAQLLLQANALQSYSPADEPAPPAALGMPEGYGNVDAVLTTVVAYNPTALKDKGLKPPTSFEDLTKPEWKGQFSADATAINWYESLVGTMGHDKAQALVKALGDNEPRLVDSHTLALTQVQGGEPMASIAIYGYLAAKTAKVTPTRLDFVNTDPLAASPDVIEMVRSAPHPAASELFMNWLLSKEGQNAMISASGRISLRDDVTSEDAAWSPDRWKAAWSQPSLDPATINAYSSELREAFHTE